MIINKKFVTFFYSWEDIYNKNFKYEVCYCIPSEVERDSLQTSWSRVTQSWAGCFGGAASVFLGCGRISRGKVKLFHGGSCYENNPRSTATRPPAPTQLVNSSNVKSQLYLRICLMKPSDYVSDPLISHKRNCRWEIFLFF